MNYIEQEGGMNSAASLSTALTELLQSHSVIKAKFSTWPSPPSSLCLPSRIKKRKSNFAHI
jgi:hypothetical protein